MRSSESRSCGGNVSMSANHDAIDASYAAVWAKASAASRRRAFSSTPPLRSWSRISPYRSGSQRGTTSTKFLAAARRSAGPPMSIISTASSSRTLRRAVTLWNG